MSTIHSPKTSIDNGYPTWSAQPMPETDLHRKLMLELIDRLEVFYAGQPVYVTGNILVFYQQGNLRKHISPDVWLARGVEDHMRPNYLIWEEPRGPEFVIELTSSTTARNDQTTKLVLYRDVLKVREYFLFDPLGDYLNPRLQGYRLRGGVYRRIRVRNGRLPSQVTGLHLEADGEDLRLWNPLTQTWLFTRAETAETRAETAEAEVARLREQLEQLRGRSSGQTNGANEHH